MKFVSKMMFRHQHGSVEKKIELVSAAIISISFIPEEIHIE